MISFVWSSKYPFWAGAGGSENYTAGQIRELQSRGIDCRLLTIGHGKKDGRKDFPDIEFKALGSLKELEQLEDTIIFVTYPLDVKTKHKSYCIVHCPPPTFTQPDPLFNIRGVADKKLIATSHMAAGMWNRFLRFRTGLIPVVYPFAEEAFSEVERPMRKRDSTRILFAGRLTPDKGIYTFLAALHMQQLKSIPIEVTVTTAGAHNEDGDTLKRMLKAHPKINVVSPRKTPLEMAKLMANNDIVVVPTTDIFWQETFGIVAVEAQHAGCRVVASKTGGLPETQCGGVSYVRPDDPLALANGLARAAEKGPLSIEERNIASNYFTVEQSVDSLLKVIRWPKKKAGLLETEPLHTPLAQLPGLSSRRSTSLGGRSK